ncbi:MAG: tRNA pseudouridine(38-40) synthase TruA [Gammaproteobacteria bacterium]|nr:tRNA pseudouridine(38-40) synthase TruA [Gammaproteobacteria bacterium]
MKIALGLEYAGSCYFGWQYQVGKATLQDILEKAIGRVADARVRIPVWCAGRTDRGVHAIHQIIHFETVAKRDREAWRLGINRYLPHDIRVLWAKEVPDLFHARFSARSRSYRYIIDNHAITGALFAKRSYGFRYPLNVSKMLEAAKIWIGQHDFSSFRAAGCQAKHAVRTVYTFSATRNGHWIILEVKADGFLYHMVRNMVGVLIPIGQGSRPVEWAKVVLDAKDRKQAGLTTSPQGLYFLGAHYPEHFEIPTTLRETLPCLYSS